MSKIIFVEKDGNERAIEAADGETILSLAHRCDVDLEGACEGSLACSTCHVIVDHDWYEKLPKASDEEEDMLDLAFGLTPTSRLGCQIILDQSLDGIKVTLPKGSRNLK